jgi:UDP-GlcNAc:undecaprenyl-phosphate GlcNAc-1-phosphate transferase
MSVYLALVVTSAIVALLMTPLVTTAATALGLLDAPGGRKVHSTSVPRLGGLAIAISAVVALAAVGTLTGWRPVDPAQTLDFRPMTPILSGCALVLAIGVADDVRSVGAVPKLLVQFAAALVVMSSGLLIERITIGGSTTSLGWLAWPITLVWLVSVTNAFNLIDGLDGLAAGISIIAGITCGAILIARGHQPDAMLVAALVGAGLGFLVYNFSPASIFLGDGGSLLFGFALASTAITGWQKGATALAAAVPLLIFALPLADAASALVRRVFRRDGSPSTPARAGGTSVAAMFRRIVEPDREHIHHRLLALGLSERHAVLILYGLALVSAAIALLTVRFE